MILKDFSNLLDNFLLSRWIIRLRASNQIISLIAYLRACCRWTLANCFWYAWAKIICSRRISLIRFIFWTNRSTCIHFECSITFFWVFFDFNLIRECCSKLARNDVHWVLSKKWLLMINSADDSHAAQSFCIKNTKTRRYCFKTSLMFSIWSFISEWNAVDNRAWIFNRIQSSSQKWLTNWVSQFKTIESDNSWCFHIAW